MYHVVLHMMPLLLLTIPMSVGTVVGVGAVALVLVVGAIPRRRGASVAHHAAMTVSVVRVIPADGFVARPGSLISVPVLGGRGIAVVNHRAHGSIPIRWSHASCGVLCRESRGSVMGGAADNAP